MGKKTYANIKSEPVINHRFGKKLTNSNYGTMEEYAAFIDKDIARVAEEAGADVYTDENTGKTVIEIK